MPRTRCATALLLAAAALTGCGGEGGPASAPSPTPRAPAPPLPAPDGPLPGDPSKLAAALRGTKSALDRAIDDWRAHGDPARGAPPEAVTLLALRQQRIYLRLARDRGLARRAVRHLKRRAAAEAHDVLAAQRALAILNRPTGRRQRFRTGPPEPTGVLLRHYREAHRRSGIGRPLLAAVNLVESAFGRMRDESVAGAQGPMQFMPSTWARYGRGGNVHDPRDAILGAARFLRAAGAPARERAALAAYNPSPLYVTAVSRYARLMRRDPRAYYALYSWQVFVRTARGPRRLTGPGR